MSNCYRVTLTLTLLLLLAPPYGTLGMQEKGGREVLPPPPPSNTTHVTPRTRHARKPESQPPTASVIVNVAPSDSDLLLNDQQVEGPTVKGIKPGSYVLTVRHVGYREVIRPITLIPGENTPVKIALEPITGTLNVTPSVGGAEINIRGEGIVAADGQGHHVGSVDKLLLAPGEYDMTVSKAGYKTVTRKVRIEAAGTVYLEPQLEALPAPATSTAAANVVGTPEPIFSADAAMALEASDDGKFVLITLTGRSGRTDDSGGVLNVTLNPSEPVSNAGTVTGRLTGFPCRVDFMPLDNILDGTIIEKPSPVNQWARIVIRIRTRNFAVPSRFAINWSRTLPEQEALRSGGEATKEQASSIAGEQYEPAVPLSKVSPAYSTVARTAHITGVVTVSVQIDERGNVKSAKAIDGPLMLRQVAENAAKHWKFKPARRNGQPVQDSQQIQFNFQR